MHTFGVMDQAPAEPAYQAPKPPHVWNNPVPIAKAGVDSADDWSAQGVMKDQTNY